MIAAVILAIVAGQSAAYAYIDPGTGSYMFQLLIGGVMAGGIMVRIYWQHIKAFFGKSDAGASDDES